MGGTLMLKPGLNAEVLDFIYVHEISHQFPHLFSNATFFFQVVEGEATIIARKSTTKVTCALIRLNHDFDAFPGTQVGGLRLYPLYEINRWKQYCLNGSWIDENSIA